MKVEENGPLCFSKDKKCGKEMQMEALITCLVNVE